MKKTFPIRVVAAAALCASAASCGNHRNGGAGSLPEGAVRVDRVVAVVDARPVTCSEVELESRIHLATDGQCAGALAALPPGLMAEMLEALIDRTLILREWGREDDFRVPAEQLDVQIAAMRTGCVTEPAYDNLLALVELTEEEIRLRRGRTLRAEGLLLERFTRVWQLQRSRIENEGLTPEARAALEDREKERILNEILDRLRQPARRVRIIDDLHGVSNCQANP